MNREIVVLKSRSGKAINQPGDFHPHQRLILLVAGVALSAVVGLYAIATPLNERRLDWILYDIYLTLSDKAEPSKSIAIVDIDDQTLAQAGQWPWPRYRFGEVLRQISSGRPAAILVDIILSEADRTSLRNIKKQYALEFGINITFTGVPEGYDDNDRHLSHVLDGSPIVLASVLTDVIGATQLDCATNVVRNGNATAHLSPIQGHGLICPLDMLTKTSALTGLVNSTIDRDGVLRRVPLVMEYDKKIFPSLALAGIMTLGGDDVSFGRDGLSDYITAWKRRIRVSNNGTALLNFRGKGRSYETVPAISILNDSYDMSRFAGKTVIIGSSATGLSDIQNTPLDPNYPGAEAHAVMIDNVMSNDTIIVPYWFEWAEFALALAIGILVTSAISRTQPVIYVTACAGGLSILAGTPLIVLNATQVYLSPFLVLNNLLAVFTIVTFAKYYFSAKNLAFVMSAISRTNESIIESMATVAELRDPETGGHIIRTREYARTLARHLQQKPTFREEITDAFVEYLNAAAPLHDIGKVGISDLILLKPGKLTTEEFETMKSHTTIGDTIVGQAERRTGNNPYLKIAQEIAMSHHEKWNGHGYPAGLSGTDIPLSARIMAVADVFDALCSRRVYKEPMDFDKTIAIIKKDSGTHFDPSIVDGFIEISSRFIEIAEKTKDS